MENKGVMPAFVKSVQAQKAPSMMNSPWAMFKTLATPYWRPKPTAMRANMPPVRRPPMAMSRTCTIIYKSPPALPQGPHLEADTRTFLLGRGAF